MAARPIHTVNACECTCIGLVLVSAYASMFIYRKVEAYADTIGPVYPLTVCIDLAASLCIYSGDFGTMS